MNVGSVEVLLQLRDLLTQQMAKAVGKSSAQLARLANEARKTELAIDKLGKSHDRGGGAVEKFGKQIRTTLVHVAAAGAAYKALGAAVSSVTDQVEFTRTFTKIANVTGVSTDELVKFKSELAGLSEATGRGPQELAEGFYSIASNGFKGAEATEVLAQAAKLAAIGLGDTNDIARSLAAAINAYGRENITAVQAADQLLVAVKAGGAEASEVAGTFGRVVAVANELGISYAEVGASIATFTRLGVRADEAVTALRGTMMALLNPSKQGEETLLALGKAGLTTASSFAELRAQVKERGLADVLIELVNATKGNVDALENLIPNSRALAGVLANAGSQADAYRQILDEVKNSHGATDAAMDNTRQSFSFLWDQVKAQAESLKLTFGEALLPAVVKFGQALNEIDPETIKRLADNVATVVDFLARGITVAINFGDALSNGLAALRRNLPGLQLMLDLERARLSVLNRSLTASKDADKAIVSMVDSTRELAEAQALLVKVRGGYFLSQGEFKQLNAEAQQAITLISALTNKRDSLAARDKAGRAEIQQQIDVEKRRHGAIAETIGVVQVYGRVQKDAVAATGAHTGSIGEATDAQKAFAQRLGEVTQRLNDQLAAAKANLAVARERFALRASGQSELAEAKELSQQARIQLEVNKQIAAFENAKQSVLAKVRAEITAQVTETIRLNDEARETIGLADALGKIIKNNAAFAGDLREQIEKQNKALGDVATNAARFGFANQTNHLERQVELADELLAAYLQGGELAARAVGIQQEIADRTDNVVQLTRQQATELAVQQDRLEQINYLIAKAGELSKPAWKAYLDAAFSTIDAIGNAFSDMFVDFATTGGDNFKSIMKSLGQSIIRIFADMLADMLKRWIATQLAMRAASQSINAGGTAGTAGSGGGLSSLAGLGSAGSTAGISGNTLGMWAAAAFALYVVYKGFIEDHKTKFASITVGSTGQIEAMASHGQKYLAGVQNAVAGLLKSLKVWMEEMNVQLTAFAQITITSSAAGFGVSAGGTGIGIFKTAEEAIAAAAAFMIRFGEFAESVPSLVQAAIRGTSVDNLSLDTLNSNIAFARTLLTQNMDQVGTAIVDATELFLSQMRRSMELFRGADLVQATDSAILHFASSLQALYDQLTGHKADPREQAERQRQAFNMQRAIMIAQITLLYEEIRARIAAIQAHIAFINTIRQGAGDGSGGGVGPGGADRPGPGVRGWNFGKGGGAYVEPTPDPRNPRNDPQLAALLQVLDNLARVLAGIPPEITAGGVKVPKPGSGRREQVRDFIEQQRFQLAQAGRSPFQQEIEEIRRSFAEQLEAAGRNVALRRELLALEQEAVAAARQRFQQDVEQRVAEATGQTNAFTELRKRFADLRKDVTDAGFAAGRAAELMARLAAAEAEAVRTLSQQMAGDLLGGLAQYIQDETVRAGFLAAQAQIKFELDMANYRAQFAILKANGQVAQAVLDKIQEAFDYIEDNAPDFGTPGSGTGGGNPAYTPGWMWVPGIGWVQIPANPAGLADEARRLLEQYQDQGLNRWQQALKRLNADFERIRAALGNTPEVAQAYADALARLREEFLSGIRDFYDSMLTGAGSPLTTEQQFNQAGQNYRRLLALVQAGDLSQADALRQAAELYQQLAARMFGTSTGGYSLIFEQIRADLAALLGINTGAGGNVIGGPEWFSQGSAAQVTAISSASQLTVASISGLSNVVDMASHRQEVILERIESRLIDLYNQNDGGPSGGGGSVTVASAPSRSGR